MQRLVAMFLLCCIGERVFWKFPFAYLSISVYYLNYSFGENMSATNPTDVYFASNLYTLSCLVF